MLNVQCFGECLKGYITCNVRGRRFESDRSAQIIFMLNVAQRLEREKTSFRSCRRFLISQRMPLELHRNLPVAGSNPAVLNFQNVAQPE